MSKGYYEKFIKLKELLKVPYFVVASIFHPDTQEEIDAIVETTVSFDYKNEYLDPTNPLIHYSIKNELLLFIDLAVYAIPVKETVDMRPFLRLPYFKESLPRILSNLFYKKSYIALSIYLRALFRSIDEMSEDLDINDESDYLKILISLCISSFGAYDILKEAFKKAVNTKVIIAEIAHSYFNKCFGLPILPDWYEFPKVAIVNKGSPLISNELETLDNFVLSIPQEISFQDSCMFWGIINVKDKTLVKNLVDKALSGKGFNNVAFLYHILKRNVYPLSELMGSQYIFFTTTCDTNDEEKIQIYSDNYKSWKDSEEIARRLTEQGLGYPIYRVRNKGNRNIMSEKQYIKSRKNIPKFYTFQKKLPSI